MHRPTVLPLLLLGAVALTACSDSFVSPTLAGKDGVLRAGDAASTTRRFDPTRGAPKVPVTPVPMAALEVPMATVFHTSTLAQQASALCAGVTAASKAAGAEIALQKCGTGNQPSQSWRLPQWGTQGPVTVYGGTEPAMCAEDATSEGKVGGTLQIGVCTGSAAQRWSLNGAGQLRNAASSLCVAPAGEATAGRGLVLVGCSTAPEQVWGAPALPRPAGLSTTPYVAGAPQEPAPVAPAPTAPIAPVDTSPITAIPADRLAAEPVLPVELAVPSQMPVTGQTWRPADAAALQQAVNQAQPGDEILLAPAVSYVGAVYLPPRSGSGWITVRTYLPTAEQPPAGTRVTPASAARFAKIVAYGRNDPAIAAADGSRGWRFTAVEITVHDSVRSLNTLVTLGRNTARSVDQIPTDFIFDRVYIHGTPQLDMVRCVGLNSARTAIVNSSVEECHARGFDSAALGGWSGPGPFRIENNSLSGAGMGVFFGGSDPLIANLSPSDIVIRNNRIWRPLSWKGVWTVKNLVEFKHGKRVLIEGNLIENQWADAQAGFVIMIKSTNQDGGAPWSQTADFTFRRNIVRNSPAGFNLAARPEQYPAVPVTRVKIEQNLFYDIGSYNGTANGRMLQLLNDLSDVQVISNTWIHNGTASHAILTSADVPGRNIVVSNNVMTLGEYGWFGDGGNMGARALSVIAGDLWRATGNLLIGAARTSDYPQSTSFAGALSEVFVNAAAGDFTLTSAASLRFAGIGMTAPGADMTSLMNATSAARAMP